MCQRAVEQKDNIKEVLELVHDKLSSMSRVEWGYAEVLTEFLRVFEQATQKCSSASEVTITLVIPFIKLFEKHISKKHPLQETVSTKIKSTMNTYFTERFGSFLHPEGIHALATAFHPRLKYLVSTATWKKMWRF